MSMIHEYIIHKQVERDIQHDADVAAALTTILAPLNAEYRQARAMELYLSMHKGLQPWIYKGVGQNLTPSIENMDPEQLEDYYHKMVQSARQIREMKRKQQEAENATRSD